LARKDEWGSSNRLQILGFTFIHQLRVPLDMQSFTFTTC
jgi:hypothetical protein